MEIPFQKIGAVDAPWIKMRIEGTEEEFDARIDTGADLTVIPENFKQLLEPVKEVAIMQADGTIKKMTAHRAWVIVAGKRIQLDRIIVRPAFTGLVGLDALSHFDLMFVGGVTIIEPA